MVPSAFRDIKRVYEVVQRVYRIIKSVLGVVLGAYRTIQRAYRIINWSLGRFKCPQDHPKGPSPQITMLILGVTRLAAISGGCGRGTAP